MLKSIEIPFGDGWAILVGNYTPAEPDGSCGWEFDPVRLFVGDIDIIDEVDCLCTLEYKNFLDSLIKKHQDKICSDE